MEGRARRLVLRTVLDLRPRTGKFVRQVVLLAASWHRHARFCSGMELLTIGVPGRELRNFMEELGVQQYQVEPGANDDFSRNGNKIEGARADVAGRRVLLLDNDTCLIGGLEGLADIPPTAIAASEAGNVRVDDAQWQVIHDEIGLALMRRAWAPLNARIDAVDEVLLLRERWLYLNSGVILFPAGHDHRGPWQSAQRAINERFARHRPASDAVTTSDQAGFASSVAAYGQFAWLPLRFNYRPPCFCLGVHAAADIRILHFTGDMDGGPGTQLGESLDHYWQERILARLERLPGSVTPAAREWRRAQAMQARLQVDSLVGEYDLDRRWQAVCADQNLTMGEA